MQNTRVDSTFYFLLTVYILWVMFFQHLGVGYYPYLAELFQLLESEDLDLKTPFLIRIAALGGNA